MLRARQHPIRSMSLADLGLTDDDIAPQGYKYQSVAPPERVSQVQFLEGATPEVAAELLSKIREAL